MDIREFVGGMEVVSGRCKLAVDEWALLITPSLFRIISGFSGLCAGCGDCPPYP
jgi:hypothetical protein